MSTKPEPSKGIHLNLNLTSWDIAAAQELYRLRLMIETIPTEKDRAEAVLAWMQLYKNLMRPVKPPPLEEPPK